MIPRYISPPTHGGHTHTYARAHTPHSRETALPSQRKSLLTTNSTKVSPPTPISSSSFPASREETALPCIQSWLSPPPTLPITTLPSDWLFPVSFKSASDLLMAKQPLPTMQQLFHLPFLPIRKCMKELLMTSSCHRQPFTQETIQFYLHLPDPRGHLSCTSAL